MLRAGRRGVKAHVWRARARFVAGVLLLVGCYWSRYADVMETHLELLDQYGAKLAALAESRRGVPLEDWAEFVYPLDRARDFARIAEQRYAERRSLHAFRQALARYAAIVDDPTLREPKAASRLEGLRAELAEAIAATRAELAREARS